MGLFVVWKCVVAFVVACRVSVRSFDAGDGRLPGIIKAENYRITLFPIIEENQRLCGHVWIDFTALRISNVILLHAADVEIFEAVIEPGAGSRSGRESDPIDQKRVQDLCLAGVYDRLKDEEQQATARLRILFKSIHYNRDQQTIGLTLPTPMQPRSHYRLGLIYKAKVHDVGQGFFRTFYAQDDNPCCKRYGITSSRP